MMANTNTKIVHRLFAADDRHAIGDTIGLNDEQKDFLTLLQTGETVVYSAGWHQAVRVKITFAVIPVPLLLVMKIWSSWVQDVCMKSGHGYIPV